MVMGAAQSTAGFGQMSVPTAEAQPQKIGISSGKLAQAKTGARACEKNQAVRVEASKASVQVQSEHVIIDFIQANATDHLRSDDVIQNFVQETPENRVTIKTTSSKNAD